MRCSKCTNELLEGYTLKTCNSCRAKAAVYNKRKKAILYKERKCTTCGVDNPLSHKYKQCQACKDRDKQIYINRIKNKMCQECGKKLPDNYQLKTCEHCLDRARQRRYTVSGEVKRRRWVTDTLRNHKYKGYIINILVDKLEQKAEKALFCEICHCKLDWSNHSFTSASPTLDRRYNGQEISMDSILIICRSCNYTKQDRTVVEFYKYVKQVLPQLQRLALNDI